MATIDDLDLLHHWDKQPHVVSAGGDDDWFDWPAELPRQVSWREMLIAEVESRPIGMVQVINPAEEESHYWGDIAPNLRAIDIWIGEAEDLGRGFGTKMMRLVLNRCFADPNVTAVLIDPLLANKRAHIFYQRLGFKPVGIRTFDKDECLVHRINRNDWHG